MREKRREEEAGRKGMYGISFLFFTLFKTEQNQKRWIKEPTLHAKS